MNIYQLLPQGDHIITGIIEPHGSSQTKNEDETLWTLLTALHIWRDSSGNIRKEPLYLLQEELAEPELQQKLELLKSCQIVTLKIQVEQANRATILEILDEDVQSDDILNALAAKLKRPLTITLEGFGEFTLDSYMDWYKGSITWGNAQVTIYVSDNKNDRQEELTIIKQFQTKQADFDAHFKDIITHELLDAKNNTCLETDESPLTAAQFKQQLQLQSIQVSTHGDYDLSFEDGDLFWGHWIIVSGNIDTGVDSISIAG